jgi:hypothetical protein
MTNLPDKVSMAVIDDIVTALTSHLTSEEKSTVERDRETSELSSG